MELWSCSLWNIYYWWESELAIVLDQVYRWPPEIKKTFPFWRNMANFWIALLIPSFHLVNSFVPHFNKGFILDKLCRNVTWNTNQGSGLMMYSVPLLVPSFWDLRTKQYATQTIPVTLRTIQATDPRDKKKERSGRGAELLVFQQDVMKTKSEYLVFSPYCLPWM